MGVGQIGERLNQSARVVSFVGDEISGAQHLQIGVRHHVAQLSGSESSVDRNDDAAEKSGGEQDFDELGTIGHEYPHVIAAADAECPQTTRR
jgi:hypothetical protein